MYKPLAYYNQDVDAANRGVGRLHKPEEHMLWNVGFLEKEEETNLEYKQLIDNLRSYVLLPYFLSKEYHDAAKQELAKVNWGNQPENTKNQYRQPLAWLRLKYGLLRVGSKVKQLLIR